VNRVGLNADRRALYRYALPMLRRSVSVDKSGTTAGRLIALLAEQGDLERLQEQGEKGDRYAFAALVRANLKKLEADPRTAFSALHEDRTPIFRADFLADHTYETGETLLQNESRLRRLADSGDQVAGRILRRLLADREPDDLRPLVDAGDSYAIAGLIRSLAHHRSEEELRALESGGDEYAAPALFLMFLKRDEIPAAIGTLRPYAQAGDPGAAELLAAQLVKIGDVPDAIAVLRPAADAGDLVCARELAFLLAEIKDVDGMRERADTGDRYAARRLTELLAEENDIEGLRAEMNAGNSDDATRALIELIGKDEVEVW
jgi:hypothetical protein